MHILHVLSLFPSSFESLTMLVIEKRSAAKFLKCSCCEGQIRTCESFLQVVNNDTGKDVRGEKYCVHCEKYARMNNEIGEVSDDEEQHLREREEYAAYQAAGCTSEFYNDKNAGYIR